MCYKNAYKKKKKKKFFYLGTAAGLPAKKLRFASAENPKLSKFKVNIYIYEDEDDEAMLNVLRCQLTY